MSPPSPKLGSLAGKIKIADDFDSPLPNDILDRFARFGPDFMSEGRGEHEQAERESLDGEIRQTSDRTDG